ncbi:MAG: 30S ribosomal protein S4 [Patescibacteria group bacterium]
MRYTGPKTKLCRREGINLFGSEKYDLSQNHRKPLGSKFGKTSGFGVQLRKKQTAKRMFGITERQFASYYKRAVRMQGVTGDNMLSFLEGRLDNVIYRASFARTIMQARQFVGHAHFIVNGKKVNIPSYQVAVGDVIELREKMKESPIYKTLVSEFEEFIKSNSNGSVSNSKWLEVNPSKLMITVKALPAKEDFDRSIDIQKIIEFYSK